MEAFDICLSLLNARTALPQTAQWFLETRQAPGTPDPSQDFWMSRVSAEGAAELQALVPRLLVLYAISRYNDLVGNSGAGWTYCALAILPEPPDEDLERQTLETLFQKVVSTESAGDLRPFWLCPRVLDGAPPHTILRVQYAREMPDLRSMPAGSAPNCTELLSGSKIDREPVS